MEIYLGNTLLNKSGLSIGTQSQVEDTYTQAPVDVREDQNQSMVHRHQGHPDEHPVSLRHRKTSADPLHKEEDKIIDQFKDLWDKAKRGECNPLELAAMRTLRGRLEEINNTRLSDAQRILGGSVDNNESLGAFSPQEPEVERDTYEKPALAAKPKLAKSSSLRKSADAAIMISGMIMNGVEPNYPADEPEDDGTHGSMPDPTDGEVSSDIEHTEEDGPMPEPTFGTQVDFHMEAGGSTSHHHRGNNPGESMQNGATPNWDAMYGMSSKSEDVRVVKSSATSFGKAIPFQQGHS